MGKGAQDLDNKASWAFGRNRNEKALTQNGLGLKWVKGMICPGGVMISKEVGTEEN